MEVEVKVTDKQGRAVSDLKREDFRLLENGSLKPFAASNTWLSRAPTN